jgi:NitT/TauT family transport system permease protein
MVAEATGHMMKIFRIVLPPALTLVVVVAAWQLLIFVFSIPPYILPGPLVVAAAISKHLDSLLHAAALTAQAAIAGFVLSLLVGFTTAVMFSQSEWIERSLYPYAIFLQTVPIVAVAPLIVLWIGHGLTGVIAVSHCRQHHSRAHECCAATT